MGALDDLVVRRGRPAGRSAPAGPVEATVVVVAADGVTFTVDSWDPQLEHGPAPYDQGGAPPPAGARCLVAWVGDGDRRRPWVLAWWEGS